MSFTTTPTVGHTPKKPKVQVAGTNDCSIHSKSSIVFKGFVPDPFLYYFVPKPTKRSPIINRGYYVRHRAIEYGFRKIFLETTTGNNVIVSLGCGFDTSALRYPDVFFIEIDYPLVCRRKAEILLEECLIKSEDIYYSIGKQNIDEDSGEYRLILSSRRYILIGGDLRNTTKLEQFLVSNGECLIVKLIKQFWSNNNQLPINVTLFNECSLCYIEQTIADQMLEILIKNLTKIFQLSTINYLGYEMFRSKFLKNDFGKFMIDHFESLGASILTYLNEDEIETRFCSQSSKLGFDSLEIVNMRQFWQEILSKDHEEMKRIDSIEPFDEWEELDNVCAAYQLTVARKRLIETSTMTTTTKDEMKLLGFQLNETSTIVETNKSTTIDSIVQYRCLPIFGHCSVYDTRRNSIQIFGGFGLEPKNRLEFVNDELIELDRNHSGKKTEQRTGHQRYSNIVELVLNSTESRLEQVNPIGTQSGFAINRVHSRVVQLESTSHSNSRFFLSGGRTSPSKIQSNLLIEIDHSVESANQHFTVLESNPQSSINCVVNSNYVPNSYRHACCQFGSPTSSKLIQFGGINHSQSTTASDTIYVLDLGTMQWSQNNVQNLNSRRHSFGFCHFDTNSILFNGGLSIGDNRFLSNFNQFEMIDSRQSSIVHNFPIANFSDTRLYSHSLATISDHEILVIGGVGQRSITNRLYRIDFRSLNVTEQYELDSKIAETPSLQLLHNFTAHVLNSNLQSAADRQNLYLIGGGGNCFSFGTHFNPISLYSI